ncbi:MAG TPA: hypothetical protein PLN45_04175 [Exilispira sp.]|nr:hypothetical protein [Exilispira sp.]
MRKDSSIFSRGSLPGFLKSSRISSTVSLLLPYFSAIFIARSEVNC